MDLISTIGTAVISSVVGPFLLKWYNTYLQNKKKRDPLLEAIRVNSLVSSKLEEIKDCFLADRIWLAQFHNGGYFYPTGKSIQKFSIIYELNNVGILPMMSQFQNIPISLFNHCMNFLSKGNIIRIPNVADDVKYTSISRVDENSKSIYVFPLFTIDNKFVGFVVLDYHEQNVIPDSILSNIEVEVSTIAGVLMSDIKKIK